MRGRYQRRLSPSEWITQFAAYIFMILVLVMCVCYAQQVMGI